MSCCAGAVFSRKRGRPPRKEEPLDDSLFLSRGRGLLSSPADAQTGSPYSSPRSSNVRKLGPSRGGSGPSILHHRGSCKNDVGVGIPVHGGSSSQQVVVAHLPPPNNLSSQTIFLEARLEIVQQQLHVRLYIFLLRSAFHDDDETRPQLRGRPTGGRQ